MTDSALPALALGRRVVSLLVLLLASSLALAAPVELPVPDRSDDARTAVLRQAMQQTLVRLTGSATPQQWSETAPMLEAPERWVAQFGYLGKPDALVLQVRFDEQELQRSLSEAGVPLWGSARPPVQMWLTSDRGDIHSAEADDDAFISALRQRAAFRGVLLSWPKMDGTDRERVSAADIRGRFDAPLRAAAERYGDGPVLAATYYPNGRPNLRWRLLNAQGQVAGGTLEAGNGTALAEKLADEIADRMAKVYAVRAGEAQTQPLQVQGVGGLAEFAALRSLVSGQAGVRAVAVERLKDDLVQLQVAFSGSSEQLQRMLLASGKLQACSPASGEAPLQSDADLLALAPLRLCWRARG